MAGTVYQFASFQLDPSQARLRKGKHILALRPKTLALLQCLLSRAGQLVTRSDLLDALWPGVAVGDEGLTTCIYELREVLHDNPHKPRFIETVHRRGDRFVAPVTAIDGDTQDTLPLLVSLENFLPTRFAGKRQVLLISGDFSWIPLSTAAPNNPTSPPRNARRRDSTI